MTKTRPRMRRMPVMTPAAKVMMRESMGGGCGLVVGWEKGVGRDAFR
jgi:hypothetical protein